ncbi:MAG: hypothetical protein AABY10_03925 [Nanoarchaeota archaeon]
MPALNIFHPDKGTQMQKFPRPASEYVLEVLKEQNRLYKSEGLVPVFPEYGRRSSFDTEVYRGFFDG